MKKKGFTLVELLAVIAILAILVIMALPAVLRMFNNARRDSFTNEVNTVIRTARQQYLLSGGTNTTWSNAEGSTKSLDLTGNSQLRYYVKMNNEGKITKLQVTNGDFQYDIANNAGIDVAESSDVETVTEKNALTLGASSIVFTSRADENSISVGDEIAIDTEHFNVISSDSTETILLAKYNLYVGYVTDFSNDTGASIVREIQPGESGYGWQSQLTATERVGVVPFSGTKYWQSTSNPNYFTDEYPDARNASVYNPNLRGELIVEEHIPDIQKQYWSIENDYSIALYVEDYVSKIRSLGINVLYGDLLNNTQALNLGCSGNTSCPYNRNLWLENTSFWVASVAWTGSTSGQTPVKTISKNGSYSYESHYMLSDYGVRPIIAIPTSTMPN